MVRGTVMSLAVLLIVISACGQELRPGPALDDYEVVGLIATGPSAARPVTP